MVERHRFLDWVSHGLLALGVMVIVFPIYLALVGCYQALSRPNSPPDSEQHLKRLISVYLVEPHQVTPNAELA
jgi:hypothetical protein